MPFAKRADARSPSSDSQPPRPRDIDYAANAVHTAILEKFGRQNELHDLRVVAGERTIRIEHQGHTAAGTRDHLLAAVRNSTDYTALWEELRTSQRFER